MTAMPDRIWAAPFRADDTTGGFYYTPEDPDWENFQAGNEYVLTTLADRNSYTPSGPAHKAGLRAVFSAGFISGMVVSAVIATLAGVILS